MSQISTREIGVIDRAIRRQCDPARARTCRRQCVLTDSHRAWVNSAQLVRAEFAEDGNVVRQNHYAVGHSVWRRRRDEGRLARFRIQAPDVVGLLVGEPQNAIVIEYWRVWINLFASGRTIFGDLAIPRVELADITSGDGGEPDIAVLVSDQTVRTGVRSLQGILLELPSLRIKPTELVCSLSGVPKRAVWCERGITAAAISGSAPRTLGSVRPAFPRLWKPQVQLT